MMLQLYNLQKYLEKKEMLRLQAYGVRPNLRAQQSGFTLLSNQCSFAQNALP